MKSIIIDDVRISLNNTDTGTKFLLEIPQGMSGNLLVKWRLKNKKEIAEAKTLLT